MAKLKIALFIPTLNGGGAERVMLLLAEEFTNCSHDVDLLLVRAVGPYLSQIPPSVRIINFNRKKPLTSIPFIISYLRRERPQAVISSFSHANLAMLWAIKLSFLKITSIVREENILSMDLKVSKNISSSIMPWLIKIFYPMATRVVSVSKGVANDLALTTGLKDNNMSIIYNPIDIYSIQSKALLRVDHPWLIENKFPVIISVGRLCEQKDFLTLIKAFSFVNQTIDAKLIILGDGEMRSQLEQKIDEFKLYDKIDLPGFVDNPFAFIARSSLFVLSSRWEGFGNVIVEALACDTPIVATNCPSGPSEILCQGKYGRIVPVGNSEALALEIIATLKGDIPRFNQHKAISRFAKKKIADDFLKILEQA